MQSCVLAHITTQLDALEAGAPVDLLFQSIAGTEAANRSFGVNLALLDEAHQAGQSLKRGAVCADGSIGDNVMYFETGQGSALSANAHHWRGPADPGSPRLRRGARISSPCW